MFVFSFKFAVLCSGVLRFGVSLALHCPYAGLPPRTSEPRTLNVEPELLNTNPEHGTWNPEL